MTLERIKSKKVYFSSLDRVIVGLSAFTLIEVPFSLSSEALVKIPFWLDLSVSLIFVFHFWSRRKELTKWNKIALFGSLPVEVLLLSFPAFHYIRVIKVLRVFECYHLFNWSEFRGKFTQIISISTMLSLVAHWIACGWVMVHDFGEVDFIEQYTTSLYWAVTTLTTVGYGDVTPTTMLDKLYAMVTMVIGVGLFGVVIGQFSSLIIQADKFKQEKRNRLHGLMDFLERYEVSYQTSNQVIQFYRHYVDKNIAEQDGKILSDLPTSLQHELKLYMKIKFIKKLPLFRGLSLDCLRLISEKLIQEFYSPKQSIVSSGQSGEEMYIIAHGEVEVKKEGQTLVNLKSGQLFGEIALIEETTRTADVISNTYTDLYVFKKNDFFEVSQKHPELKERMLRVYQARREGSKKIA